jgi:hypothetical protein
VTALVHEHRHLHDRGSFRGVWHVHLHRHPEPRRHRASVSIGLGRRLAEGPHQHGHRRSAAALLTARAS